jgi:hypothetical protein
MPLTPSDGASIPQKRLRVIKGAQFEPGKARLEGKQAAGGPAGVEPRGAQAAAMGGR